MILSGPHPFARILLCCAAATMAGHAWSAYKCVDERGKSHYQDTPPAECANVVTYEVSPSGKVLRRIEPTSAAAPPPATSKEADRASLDRARRDRTLLDSFSNEKEIDAARDRSLQLLTARVTDAESRLEHARARRKQAVAAKADSEKLRNDEAAAEKTLAGYRAERQRVVDDFERDKQRWRELKSGAR
ncbi:MAG TPA: DUF4124 domain-containing protein [Usitatibacter sp.]|nr:DUF4124 domain-containing protein [Usitatibacter sp.]